MPVVVITNGYQYRYNWTFAPVFMPNPTFEPIFFFRCAYLPYGNNPAVYGSSAYRDVLIVPFQGSSNITYGVYQSSNPILGGNGTEVCQAIGSSFAVPLLSGLAQTLQTESAFAVDIATAPTSSPLTQVLPNGQIALLNVLTTDASLLQLSPSVSISANAPNGTIANIIATNFISQTSIPLTLTSVTTTPVNPVNPSVPSSKHFMKILADSKSTNWWLWGSLILVGVILVIGVTGYLIHKSRKRG
jgi:hypothetical protein